MREYHKIETLIKEINMIREENGILYNYEEGNKYEVSFAPLYDKENNKIVAVTQYETCMNCGEKYVTEMYTYDGEGEELAIDMGFRDDDEF